MIEEYKKFFDKKAKENESIKEHTENLLQRERVLEELGYIKDEKEIKSLKDAIIYHDIGKSNRNFQDRLENQTKFKSGEVGHNILSAILYFFYNDNKEALYAILEHHRYVDNNIFLSKNIELVENEIQKMLEDIGLDYRKQRFDVEEISWQIDDLIVEMNENVKVGDYFSIKILGNLMRCDYSASAHLNIDYPNDFLNEKMNNLLKKWKEYDSNANWRDVQLYCKENTDNNIIVVAPTGTGKTEAGLLWIGNNKGFFILPIKTAIESIFDRIKNDIIENENLNKRVALLTGETYSRYQRDDIRSTVEKNLEYVDETRRYAIPLTISTPDQIFDFVFKAKGCEIKYAMLNYSKFVIDEIQSYSADLLPLIIFGIQKIIELGGKVAIITATFPPFVEDLLFRTDSNKKESDRSLFKKKEFKTGSARHNIKIEKDMINSDYIYKHYKNNDSKHKKYLVVVNTVKKAQQLYEELESKGLKNLKIIHSKFDRKDRRKLENEIKDTGKTLDDNNNLIEEDVIWIATQVIEASLDIDLDYLFTELSDLNALFQRMGRVNRKGKKSIDDPNIFIFTKIEEKYLKTENSKGFIDKGIYRISKRAIENFNDGIISEEDKQNMINEYLTTDNLKKENSNFYVEYWNKYDYVKNLNFGELDSNKFRNILSYDVFPCDENGKFYREEIYELEDKIQDIRQRMSDNYKNGVHNNSLIEKYMKLKDEILSYTVSVGFYDYISYNNNFGEVEVSKYRKIRKLRCKYDELGFRRCEKSDNNKGIFM